MKKIVEQIDEPNCDYNGQWTYFIEEMGEIVEVASDPFDTKEEAETAATEAFERRNNV